VRAKIRVYRVLHPVHEYALLKETAPDLMFVPFIFTLGGIFSQGGGGLPKSSCILTLITIVH
jgi:hypothetical protein